MVARQPKVFAASPVGDTERLESAGVLGSNGTMDVIPVSLSPGITYTVQLLAQTGGGPCDGTTTTQVDQASLTYLVIGDSD